MTSTEPEDGFSPLGKGRLLPIQAVRTALELLPTRQRRLLGLATAAQMSLGLLDLAGIALVGAVAAVMVSGVQSAALPAWLTPILDTLGLSSLTNSQLIGVLGGLAAISLLGKTAISALLSRKVILFLAQQQAHVSARLARELFQRPLLDVQRWSSAEVIYALSPGVGAAVVGVLGGAVAGAAELFLFLIVGVTLLIVDPILTIVAAALFAVILYVLQIVLGRLAARNARRLADASIGTTGAVQEALATYRETAVLNRRELYSDRFEGLAAISARAVGGNQYILEIPKYVLEATLIVASFALAIIQFVTKDLTAAATTVAIFLTAGFRIIPAMLRLQAAGINIRNGNEGARSTFELAHFLRDNPNDPAVRPQALPKEARAIRELIAEGKPGFEATLTIEEVSVQYPGADEFAVNEVSFALREGSSLALVGGSGAGKSTLADVILGVLQPTSGKVLIGGVPPAEAIRRWPGAMAYVPQVVALVEGSVRDNVALGLPPEAIDDDRVWEALERAHLAAFLRQSRDSLDTEVGERGIRLSGGQRQRLGIARALYTRPRLLVLDEATSALDAETEMAVVETLKELEGEVTTVTIAHRLATVRTVETLVFMREGRVVSSGTFDEVRTAVPDFDRQASLLGL